jgi:alkylhydroperoxidase family enzyme
LVSRGKGHILSKQRRRRHATFSELKTHLDKESLTDLVLIISFYNAVVRFLATMEIDNEPEYQALLAEFPFGAD